jgi:hypothetical protein
MDGNSVSSTAVLSIKKHSRYLIGLLLVILTGTCLNQRYRILKEFSFIYTDHDQALMWCAAHEFNAGKFHEPHFYGQNFNSMFEALLAVPLMKFNIEPPYAVPIATVFLALAPFLILAISSLIFRNWLAAVFSLALFLALPLRFHMITSMPRGFTVGPAFAALSLLFPIHSRSRQSACWFGFLSLISIILLRNSILIVLPAWIYWLFRAYKDRAQLIYFFSGILLGAGVYILSQSFYWLHPEYAYWNEKPGVMLEFDWQRLVKGFGNLELFYQNSLPIVFNQSIFFFLLPAGVLAAAAYYRKWNLFFPVLSVVLILAAVPGFARFYVGTESVFHSCSRFFLPIPVLLVLAVMWLENQHKAGAGFVKYRTLLITAVFILGMLAGIYNFRNLPSRVQEEIRIPQYWLSIGRVDRLYSLTEILDERLQENNTSVVIMSDYLDAYAYSALSKKRYLGILPPRIDRRTWLLKQEMDTVKETVAFLGFNAPVVFKPRWKIESEINPAEALDLVFIKTGGKTLSELLDHMGFPFRPF